MWKMQLFQLNYDKIQAQAVKEILNNIWTIMGEKIKNLRNNNYANSIS
jgi:hypothetical protein